MLSCFVFLPFQEIFLGCPDCAVAQTFRIIAGKDDLHRAEEPRVENHLLIGKKLPDAVADRDVAVLQLDNADRDAVDVEHEVGPPLVGCRCSVTSSAMAKSLAPEFSQSITLTVSVTLPASIFTGTP